MKFNSTDMAVLEADSVVSRQLYRTAVKISGFVDAIPSRVVTNDEISRLLNTDDRWIVANTGIHERRFLDEDRAASDLAVEAVSKCLELSALRPEEVDALIVVSSNPDQPFPSTALMVKDAVGADSALPLDLTQGACSGGLLAIEMAAAMIGDRYRNIIVVAAEVFSRQTDPQERTTRVFFGDAGGAVLVSRASREGQGIRALKVRSNLDMCVGIAGGGSRRPLDASALERGEQYLYMNGRRVWELATELIPGIIREVCAEADVSLGAVDNFVLHQANRNIIANVMESLGIDETRAAITVDLLGNTGAASIFTALAKLNRERRVEPGKISVVATIGAGFIWGAMVLFH